ncbi:flagellar associated protein [Trypanosoma rangeli]|uniref:Flagellar associated protein n=1 Tax=Trypanosoma rangeli TaxID=5698 RepID=A0A422NFQ5_TRYRA|nr:flagellar associated protein [Trypanosoma rangeli]RNF04267.1 flagellar associated protein [Trypanosoma rangeli]|eukprot:RNF04267.1 flagellar associated protein [Trypanosoma rangeli]
MTAPAEAVKEKAPLHVYPEAEVGTSFFSHHGLYSMRYNGVCALTGSIVLMASGRFVMFVDVKSGKIMSTPGPENGGVGVVAVHPSRRFYVVCEKLPNDPLIRVYSWPSREEVGQFVGGATRGFSACCFNKDGTMMATVGMYPDYSLAVWNWNTRGMILRSKCHNSDVYTVVFSRFDSGVLVTGGAGNIKFWSMANTFTGLKLQGLLGKFGRLEITNVSGFVVLSDGKVLSGSECGLILLWEGDLVRCCFAQEVIKDEVDGAVALAVQSYDYKPCHNGAINVLELLEDGRVILTAGDDGYMRYWRVSELETAEGDGAPPLYAPECLCEVLVDPQAHIRAMTLCRDTNEWVVLDSTGALWRVPYIASKDILARSRLLAKERARVALRFTGGGITSAAVSPIDHTVVTGGEDGKIRLIDYVTPQQVYEFILPVSTVVVALRFLRTDTTGMKLIACCENGTVLLLQRGSNTFVLLGQWRPHTDGLMTMTVDRDERRLCTISTNGTVFFFDIDPDLSAIAPIGFCCLPLKDVRCAAWDDATSCCLLGYESGKLLAIQAPKMEEMDHSVSFEFTCIYALVGIRQRKLAEKKLVNLVAGERADGIQEEEEEEDMGPWPVHLICPLPDGSFAVGFAAPELLYRYHLNIRYDNCTELPPLPPTGIEPPDYLEEPMNNLCYRDLVPKLATVSISESFIVVICESAQVILRSLDSSEKSPQECILAAAAHDRLDGQIATACTSFDDSMLVSVGSDGLVMAQIRKGYHAPLPPKIQAGYPPLRAEEVVPPQPIALSISEQKEADDRRSAEEAKQRELDAFLAKLHVVHAKYAELLAENSAAPVQLRLSEKEMALHPQILQEMEEEKQRRVKESRNENALQVAREDVRTRKMRDRFIDNLIYDHFQVISFSKEFAVSSFRTPNPETAIRLLDKEINDLLSFDAEEDAAGRSVENDGTNDSKSRSKTPGMTDEAGSAEVEDARLATAAGINEWLATEEKHRQEQLKLTREESGLLTTTMRQHLVKMDERREERRRRKQGYEKLLTYKPDPAAEAAQLEAKMRHEVARRGECVLRTDPSYNSKPSAVSKLHQLIWVEKIVLRLRSTFTKKLLLLRDEKATLCKSLNVFLRRIREINHALKETNAQSADVHLAPIERPEQRFVIDHEGLEAFAKQRHKEKMREELARKAQRGFGADLVGTEASANNDGTGALMSGEEGDSFKKASNRMSITDHRTSPLRRQRNRNMSPPPRSSRAYNTAVLAAVAVRERMDNELRAKLENVKLTEVEEEEQQMERERLIAERYRLQCRVDSMMKSFDQRLWELHEERVSVDADLSLADARSLLMFNEYQILLVFRHKDRELRLQYEETKRSRDQRNQEVTELQKEVQEQAGVIEKLQETNKAFRHEGEFFIESHFPAEHVPYIIKVFLRQIKRRKNLGDVSADDDDITSDDDDEDLNEEDLWEEVCPPNCSGDRWQEVLAMREKRLDYVDAIAGARRKQEEMQRCIEEHKILAEKLNTALSLSLKAIEEFQGEKRKELNMLQTLVALRCSQVRCLEEEKCPDTFRRDDLVVISDHVMAKLHHRIEEMAEEKRDWRMKLKEMTAELQRLQRERTVKEALHAKWKEKVYEAMMLKFGCTVNLELLESTTSCREVEELKEQLRIEELSWERELRKREKKITALRETMQRRLVENTRLLHELGDQESSRQDVERSLSCATQKVVSRMYDGSNVATAEDRRNLKLLIAAQQEEIDALRAEVSLLRSKVGHLYAPSVAFTT